MPDIQPTPILDSERAKNATTETVLELLLDNDAQRPWTLHEIALDIGSNAIVEDAVGDLHSAGLVHKTADGFIFATRAAIRYQEITG